LLPLLFISVKLKEFVVCYRYLEKKSAKAIIYV
jgi:hypothetical protein